MSESARDRLRFGERMGLNLGPIPIRVALALTFIWAGAGKFFAQDEFTGEAALALYEMGVIAGPAGTDPAPAPDAAGGEDGSGDAGESADPPPTGNPGGEVGLADGGAVELTSFVSGGANSMQPNPQNETGSSYTAADFAEPIKKMRLYGVAVTLYQGANPGYEEGTSTPRSSFVPQWAAGGKTPVWLAWAVSITELVGGVLILVGLLTRLSALGLFCTMCGAMWLTVCGPAMQGGGAFLGFLPAYGAFSYDWGDPLWLAALMGASGSLVFIGAGPVSLHNLLFASRNEDDDEDLED